MSRITHKMGFVSPLGEKSFFAEKQDLEEKGYYEGKINFQALVDYLKGNPKFQFYHENFISKRKKVVPNLSSFSTSVDTHIPLLASLENGEQYEMKMEGKLNKRIDRVVLRQSKIHFNFEFTTKKETEYNIGIKYEFFDENAIELKVYTYEDLEFLTKYLEVKIPEYLRNEVTSKFNVAFKAAKSDCNVIDNLYEFAPDFVIFNRNNTDLWNDLVSLSKCQINEESSFFSGSNENIAVLNILSNFPNKLYLFFALKRKPKLINTLMSKIDDEYEQDLIRVLCVVCMEVWTQRSIANAPFFLAEDKRTVVQKYPRVDSFEKGYCVIATKSSKEELKKERKTNFKVNKYNEAYEIGIVESRHDGFNFSPTSHSFDVHGYANPLDPLRTRIKGESFYIPAEIAFYLTEELVSSKKLNLLSNVLDAYISAPVATVSMITTVIRSTKQLLKNSIRSKIARRFRAALSKIKNNRRSTDEIVKKSNERELYNKLDDFIRDAKKSGIGLEEITFYDIIKNLRGVTPQSTKVAEAAEKGLIGKRIIEDEIFEALYTTYTKKPANNVSAFAFGGITYHRKSTPFEVFFKEFVHEGTHILDDLTKIAKNKSVLLKETQNIIHEGERMKKYVSRLTSDQLIEFRARIFEREFEIANNLKLDFKTVKKLVKFIKKNY